MVEATILIRGLFIGQVRRYPFFYLQLGVIFICSLIAYPFYYFHPSLYAPFFWYSSFLTMFLACGNIWEVLRRTFPSGDPGRFFACGVGMLLAIAITLFTVIYLRNARHWKWDLRMWGLQRDFRTIQALALLAVIASIIYFGRRLSGNLKGILFGYSTYVGLSLGILAVQYYFRGPFGKIGSVLDPYAFFFSLLIYLVALWNYTPPPEPQRILPMPTQEPLASRS